MAARELGLLLSHLNLRSFGEEMTRQPFLLSHQYPFLLGLVDWSLPVLNSTGLRAEH